MAALGLLLIFIFSLVSSVKPNVDVSLKTMLKCTKMFLDVKNCWLEHPDLPSCEPKTALMSCGESHVDDLPLNYCRDLYGEQINGLQILYGAVREAVCENHDLRTNFAERYVCWYTLRSCSARFVKWKSIRDPDPQENCRVCIEEAHECALQNPWCLDLHYNLSQVVCGRRFCPNMMGEMEMFFEGLRNDGMWMKSSVGLILFYLLFSLLLFI